jgi:hypothetical protein
MLGVHRSFPGAGPRVARGPMLGKETARRSGQHCSHGPLQGSPQRRYASVEQFAEDIRRHLGSLPVVARKAVPAFAFPLREL